MSDKAVLSIHGMSCAACVRRVEQGLSDLDGVSRADVNFATEKATVEYDRSQLAPDELSKKVADLGYEVVGIEEEAGEGQQKTTVMVGGMTCAACVRRVENAISSVPGVTEAAVNLATGRATVSHESDWGGLEALKTIITDTGYEFLGVPESDLEDRVEAARLKDIKELRAKFLTGAVLSVIIFMGSMQGWFPFLAHIPRQTHAAGPLYSHHPGLVLGGEPFLFRRHQGRAAEDHRHEYPGGRGRLFRLSVLFPRHIRSRAVHGLGYRHPCIL